MLLISVLWVNTVTNVFLLCHGVVTEDAELSVYHSAVVSASIHTMPGKESLQLLKVCGLVFARST